MNNDKNGLTDSLLNLRDKPIYIHSNTDDRVVPPELHRSQKYFFEHFHSNVKFEEKPWIHTWPTDVPAEWGDELRFWSELGFWGRKKGECS